MPYTTVTGTNGGNFLGFRGDLGFYNETLVNPYTGYTVNVSGIKNVNNAIYDGLDGYDILSMTSYGDVFSLVDADGVVMLKNVERITAGADGDIINLAHATVPYGNITIRGTDGDDIIWSNLGDDVIFGDLGDDIIDGGLGDDLIFAGLGDDYLSGWEGADTMLGGAGDDIFAYNVDSIWSGGYTLASLGSAVPFAAQVGLDGKNRSHDIFQGDADELYNVHDTGSDTLILTDGDDVLVASDALSPSNNTYFPRVSYIDIVEAGDGDDVVDFSGVDSVAVTINGGDGNDTLGGSNGNDTLNGGGDDDRLFGSTGDDTLDGGAGDDVYYYNPGDGNDTIVETSGTDSIVFGAGISLDDLTLGGDGDDLLISVGGATITIVNHFAADHSGRVESLVFDDNSSFDLASYELNVDPVAHNDVFSGDEDMVVAGNVLTNDTDENGDILSVAPATIMTENGGTVILNADGSFSYQGAANFYGTENFSYSVADGNGGQSLASVTLNILSVNDNPVAGADAFAGNEDEVITGSLLDNDSDVDGDILSAQAETITTANGGSATINADGTFSYLGAANFHGSDAFEYTVMDGQGGQSSASVTLNVLQVNDDPAAAADSFFGNEDEIITGSLLGNDYDADGDTLSAVAQTITTANGGSVTINADGTFSYLGAANFHGNDLFDYTVGDGQGGFDTASVSIAIAAINDAPVAADDAFTGYRSNPIMGNVLSNDSDIDGDALFAQAGMFATANGGSVTIGADGSFTYLPANGFYGNDSFDYSALDGHGGSASGTVNLTVALDASVSIVGTDSGETLVGTDGDDQIFGLGGDDILYGDDGILAGVTHDKQFADTIIMPGLKEGVDITDLRPSGDPARGIAEGNLSVDYDATASITFRKGQAGYDNSFGTFGIAEDGTIVSSSMKWANVKTAGIDVTHQIDLPVGASGGAFGFFIVADGNNKNGGYSGLDVTGDGTLSFIYNYGKAGQRAANIDDPGTKISLVYDDGATARVLQGDVYFTTERGDGASINKDGKVHVVSGLMEENDLSFDPKASDHGSKAVGVTEGGITAATLAGTWAANGDGFGTKSSGFGSKSVSGGEALHVGLASGVENIMSNLMHIFGVNSGIDFKTYIESIAPPIAYEHTISSFWGTKAAGVLDAFDFSGLVTGGDISSVYNSEVGTKSSYPDNVQPSIPGALDTDTLRIGFEDLYNMGDADYEDVLFDLNINPAQVGDIGGGNDLLDGGAGNDILYGEGGDDILVLGDGYDQAYGGEGADTFAITMIDASVDKIHDFNGGEGDVINIADVLDSYDPLSDDIADFVRLVQNGSDTELQISVHGDGSFAAAALIVGGTDDALATLIANGALVADQSALA